MRDSGVLLNIVVPQRMDTTHEQRPVHEKQRFGLEQAGALAECQTTTPKVFRRKGKKRLKEGSKEQRRTVWLCGTQKRTPQNRREETVGISRPLPQSERELKLHIPEKHRGERQGARPEAENGGNIGSSGRGVRDVRGHVGCRGKRVCCRRWKNWRRHGSTRIAPWKCEKIVARAWMVPSGSSATAVLFMKHRGSM